MRSDALGHHFAGRGNPFWRLLHESGLTSEPLSFEQDGRLPAHRYALTNVCSRASRGASDLAPEELRKGCRALERKIRRLRPEIVAFVGITMYRHFFGRPAGAGPGAKRETIAGARVFVLPNPSGRNAAFASYRSKLRWCRGLCRVLLSTDSTRETTAS